MKADRHNKGKLKWSLVHYKSLEPMVQVLEMGAEKYSPDNWKKGLDKKEILKSMMRHLTALMDGEAKDPESGISHMGHIQCNAMFYNYHDSNQSFICEPVDSSRYTNLCKEFFNKFSEPYRTQALTNCIHCYTEPRDAIEALCIGFKWSGTTEGYSYWRKFTKSLEDAK